MKNLFVAVTLVATAFLSGASSLIGCSSSTSNGTGDGDGDGGDGDGDGSGGSEMGSGGTSSGGTNGATGGEGGMNPGGAPGSGGSGPDDFLGECFTDLPTEVGSFQDATKESEDGDYIMRLALDTMGSFGTSGTYGWEAVRFGLIAPGVTVCLDADELTGALATTHHNCGDVLTITVGTTRYEIENPDSAVDYVDPEAYRRPATLTIYEDDVQVGEPIRLDTTSCNDASGDGVCRSGGPC